MLSCVIDRGEAYEPQRWWELNATITRERIDCRHRMKTHSRLASENGQSGENSRLATKTQLA